MRWVDEMDDFGGSFQRGGGRSVSAWLVGQIPCRESRMILQAADKCLEAIEILLSSEQVADVEHDGQTSFVERIQQLQVVLDSLLVAVIVSAGGDSKIEIFRTDFRVWKCDDTRIEELAFFFARIHWRQWKTHSVRRL